LQSHILNRVNQHPPVRQLDGWCADRILFSIPVPSQVDLFSLPFLSPDLTFFFATLFSPCPLPSFFSPWSLFFYLEPYFLLTPHLVSLFLFFCAFATYIFELKVDSSPSTYSLVNLNVLLSSPPYHQPTSQHFK